MVQKEVSIAAKPLPAVQNGTPNSSASRHFPLSRPPLTSSNSISGTSPPISSSPARFATKASSEPPPSASIVSPIRSVCCLTSSTVGSSSSSSASSANSVISASAAPPPFATKSPSPPPLPKRRPPQASETSKETSPIEYSDEALEERCSAFSRVLGAPAKKDSAASAKSALVSPTYVNYDDDSLHHRALVASSSIPFADADSSPQDELPPSIPPRPLANEKTASSASVSSCQSSNSFQRQLLPLQLTQSVHVDSHGNYNGSFHSVPVTPNNSSQRQYQQSAQNVDYTKYLRPQAASRVKSASVYGSLTNGAAASLNGESDYIDSFGRFQNSAYLAKNRPETVHEESCQFNLPQQRPLQTTFSGGINSIISGYSGSCQSTNNRPLSFDKADNRGFTTAFSDNIVLHASLRPVQDTFTTVTPSAPLTGQTQSEKLPASPPQNHNCSAVRASIAAPVASGHPPLHPKISSSGPPREPPPYDALHRKLPPNFASQSPKQAPNKPQHHAPTYVNASPSNQALILNNNPSFTLNSSASGSSTPLSPSPQLQPKSILSRSGDKVSRERYDYSSAPIAQGLPQRHRIIIDNEMQLVTGMEGFSQATNKMTSSHAHHASMPAQTHKEVMRQGSCGNYENVPPAQGPSGAHPQGQASSGFAGAYRRAQIPNSQSTPSSLMAAQRSCSNLDLQAASAGTSPSHRHTSIMSQSVYQPSDHIDLRRPSQPAAIRQQVAPLACLREYGSTSSIDAIGKKMESEQQKSGGIRQGMSRFLRGASGKGGTSFSTADKDVALAAHKETPKKAAPAAPSRPSNFVDSRGPNLNNLDKVSTKNALSRDSSKQISLKEKAKPGRTKSLANDSIFRKLIGVGSSTLKPAQAASELSTSELSVPGLSSMSVSTVSLNQEGWSAELKQEETLRKRVFAHYDTLSITADPYWNPLEQRPSQAGPGPAIPNTTTGASAASRRPMLSPQWSEENPVVPQTGVNSSPPGSSGEGTPICEQGPADNGDGKCNQLLISCPYFRNEIGSERTRQIALCKETETQWIDAESPRAGRDSLETWIRPPAASEISVMENLSGIYLGDMLCAKRVDSPIIEHADAGCFYYRHCFAGKVHSNYFGIDEQFGPVAISLIRERLPIQDVQQSCLCSSIIYRIIVRLSDLTTFRGTILEDTLPSFQALITDSQQFEQHEPLAPTKLPVRELLELIVPDLQISCLRLALPVPQTEELLIKLDEQSVNNRYKVGIMYCKAGQCTEEQMYNNETSGPAFDEFLDMMGQRVRLKGFDKYKGGLDTKGESTGQYSLYTTFEQYELMFHVSTLLPYTASNRQQLSRKRHIGNDIVTVIFQEPGALPFTPQTVRSHFQHVFIVVRVNSPNTDAVSYSIAVSRSKDVPTFGPQIPANATFAKCKAFRDFLLTKIINAENAVHKSEKFAKMSARTAREYIRDLAEKHVTSHTVPESSGSKLSSLILGKKKDRPKPKLVLNSAVKGAVVWKVQVEDFSLCRPIDAALGISTDSIVIIEHSTRDVVFTCRTHAIIGWTSHGHSLKLYYDHGDVVILRTPDDEEQAAKEILQRLKAVTKGCETHELVLRRNAVGQLGFHIQHEGIVSDVEMYGFAWQAGLRQGSRLVEICKVSTSTLSHDKMLELLRTSATVRVLVIPPLEDGCPRRGCADPYCSAVLGTSESTGQPTTSETFPQQRSGFRNNHTGAGSSRQVPSTERSSFRRQVIRQQHGSAQQDSGTIPGAKTEARTTVSVPGADYGYESGHNLSSRSLDELENSPNKYSADGGRSSSADQGFFSAGAQSDNTQDYPNNTLSSASSDERWFNGMPLATSGWNRNAPPSHNDVAPGGHQPLSGPTDTLSSTGSTASSEHSSDSILGTCPTRGTVLQSPRRRQRPPDMAKRRVDKVQSCDPSAASGGAHQQLQYIPSLPPKAYAKVKQNGAAQTESCIRRRTGHSHHHSNYQHVSEFYSPGTSQHQQQPLSNGHRARSEDSLTIAFNNGLQLQQHAELPDRISQSIHYPGSSRYATEQHGCASLPHGGGGQRREAPQSSTKSDSPPQGSQRRVDWNQLVDVASRAIEGISQRHVSVPNITNAQSPETNSCFLKLEAAQQRIAMLEERVDRLTEELHKEREAKNLSELETMNLRDANKRLEEERVSAEAELKRFTEWFFRAVDSNFAAVGGPPPPAAAASDQQNSRTDQRRSRGNSIFENGPTAKR